MKLGCRSKKAGFGWRDALGGVVVGIVFLVWMHDHAHAQTIVAPSSHWGALMYPDMKPTQTLGLNFALFSEFGKAIGPDGKPAAEGAPNRYNFQDETLGFNVLSVANTRPLKRGKSLSSNLLYTSTLTLGVIGDRATRYFQNDVIHKRLLKIPPVQRGDVVRCDRDFPRCVIAGYSGELNYHLYSFDRNKAGLLFVETPLFVGAGASASTIQNDVYSQLGFREAALWPRHHQWPFLTVSGMGRMGLMVPSVVFRHLAEFYGTAQGSVALHVFEYTFPVVLEVGITGTTGQFIVDRRKTEFEAPAPALREGFITFNVRLGGFRFETFNDLYAGKDEGPTFGAAVYFSIWQDSKSTRWISWL